MQLGISRITICLILWILNIHPGDQLTSSQKTAVDKFVKDVMACRNIVGLSLSVVHGDESMNNGYGLKDLVKHRKVDTRTMFCIGSLTKGFTVAVLGMVLERDRRWTWDTPISDILGDDFQLSDEFRTKYLTLKDILAHRSGIPGYFGGFLTGFSIDRDTLVSRLRYMKPTRPAHSKYMYNNYMYVLAGYIAERISGKTWEELVQELFDKLGMTSTTFVKDLKSNADIARCHVSINGSLVQMNEKLISMIYPGGPAGSICSNAEDMEKWLRFQIRKSVLPSGERLINLTTFEPMHTPHMPTPMPLGKKILKLPVFPIDEGRFAYDLGWGSGMYRGYHTLLHAGDISGYLSKIWLIPDANIGIFTTTNGPGRSETQEGLRVVHHYISDTILGLDPWLNSSTACSFPDPWLSNFKRKQGTTKDTRMKRNVSFLSTLRPLTDFVGTYVHLAFGNITVAVNESTGKLNLYHGRFGHAVMHQTKNIGEFDMKFIGYLEFVSVADGWKHNYKIQFNSSDGGDVDILYAGFIEGSAPPEFRRGLNWNAQGQNNFDKDCSKCCKLNTSGCSAPIPNFIVFLILYSVLPCLLSM